MSEPSTISPETPSYIRCPQFRSKLVLDQLLGPTVTNYQLKKITNKGSGDGARHFYTPIDIREAKFALYNIDPAKQPLQRPPIIYTRMAKGGTGKSTVSGNVASALAMLGYKVLAIDGDPQASLTNMLGIDTSQDEITHIGDLMVKSETEKTPVDFSASIKHIYPDGMLDLIPADITLTQTDAWLMTRMVRDTIFERLISNNLNFFGQYDVIVIDSAPGTTLLSYNFMAACETVLAVVWLDRESLKAINLLMSNVEEINRSIPGKNLDIEIIANGFHPSYKHCKEALSILAATYPGAVNENVIPHNTGFSRQQSLLAEDSKGPLVEQDPFSAAAKSMFDLAKGLLGRYHITLAGWDESVMPITRK
ncbi:MAG: ParA family protein [Pseudomonadota bacterium]